MLTRTAPFEQSAALIS